jgi:molybdopterin-guanine dinucleotide biosynthesis protein A
VRPEHDAVVLAGGRARRLGGARKPEVLLAGRRLIDHTLEAAAQARSLVVVGSADMAPPGAVVTLEDPPGGGPVAGLAAGLAALPNGSALVLVLACDVPRASRVVDRLFRELPEGADGRPADGAVPSGAPDGALPVAAPDGALPIGAPDGALPVGASDGALPVGASDGAVLVDAAGRRQPLLAVYRRASLDAALARLSKAGGLRDAAVWRLVEGLRLVEVRDLAGDGVDVDTWADLAAAERDAVTPPR